MRLDAETISKIEILYQSPEEHTVHVTEQVAALGLEGERRLYIFSVFDDFNLTAERRILCSWSNKRPPLTGERHAFFAYSYWQEYAEQRWKLFGLACVCTVLSHRRVRDAIYLHWIWMEELRGVMARKWFVLTLINKRIIKERNFYKKEAAAVILR